MAESTQDPQLAFKNQCDDIRAGMKAMCEQIDLVKKSLPLGLANPGETTANLTLAFRHVEDAAMRIGKAIQAATTGVSPLGGPTTPAPIGASGHSHDELPTVI